jgi:RNA polymerase sigma-70 factor (ECF subfamily)
MPDDSLNTVALNALVGRMCDGDRSAQDELIRAAAHRLRGLAVAMLRKYPGVARWEQPDDVFQEAVVRLLRAVEKVRPANTRAFYGLAAEQIRRHLLDLARRYSWMNARSAPDTAAAQPSAPAAADLAVWSAFHEAVAGLPVREREAFMLTFYHGWTQGQAADLLGVDARTVRRWLQAATDALSERLGGDLPVA